MASYGSFSRASDAVYAEQWGHPLVLWILCQQSTFTTAYLLYYGSDGSRCVRSQSSLYCVTCDAINMRSSLTNSSNSRYKFHYRETVGLRIALVEFIVYVIVMILLTAIPHAILLSVTGQLFPSSFSSSFIPLIIADCHHYVTNLWCGKWYDRQCCKDAQDSCRRFRGRFQVRSHLRHRHSTLYVYHICVYPIASTYINIGL